MKKLKRLNLDSLVQSNLLDTEMGALKGGQNYCESCAAGCKYAAKG